MQVRDILPHTSNALSCLQALNLSFENGAVPDLPAETGRLLVGLSSLALSSDSIFRLPTSMALISTLQTLLVATGSVIADVLPGTQNFELFEDDIDMPMTLPHLSTLGICKAWSLCPANQSIVASIESKLPCVRFMELDSMFSGTSKIT